MLKPEYLTHICNDGLQRMIYQAMDDCRADPKSMKFSATLAMLIEEKAKRELR